MNAARPRKRLLVLNHATTRGGASLSLEHLLQSINLSEYDVTVYCRSDRDDFAVRLESLGFSVIYAGSGLTPFAHFSGAEFPARSMSAVANVWRIVRDSVGLARVLAKGYDLVVVNSMTLFWAGRLAKLFRCNTALFHRETYVRGRWGLRTRLIKHELMRSFDGVAYISQFDRQESGDSRPTSTVITDKVDLTLYSSTTRCEARRLLGIPGGFYVLYLGGAAKLKGPDTVLRALQLMDPRVSLLFLGISSKEESIEILEGVSTVPPVKSLQSSRGLTNMSDLDRRVLFRPATDDIHLYFLAADVVVFPSARPHQARPIYESGAARRLILLSDFAHTKEFALHGSNCIEFPPGDAAALASHVNDVFRTPSDYSHLVHENWLIARRNHNLEDLAEEVGSFLGGLL